VGEHARHDKTACGRVGPRSLRPSAQRSWRMVKQGRIEGMPGEKSHHLFSPTPVISRPTHAAATSPSAPVPALDSKDSEERDFACHIASFGITDSLDARSVSLMRIRLGWMVSKLRGSAGLYQNIISFPAGGQKQRNMAYCSYKGTCVFPLYTTNKSHRYRRCLVLQRCRRKPKPYVTIHVLWSQSH
jgi:hypothetical protein